MILISNVRVYCYLCQWTPYNFVDSEFGLFICPMKMMSPDDFSRMANRKGRSSFNCKGCGPAEVSTTPTEVTAAASVPSSFTSIKVLWFTSLIINCPPALMPVISAAGVNAMPIPRLVSSSFNLHN